MLGIINDLLNFSRIESGQVAYELEELDAHQMVNSVMDLVQSQATLKRIEMVHGPCPANVHIRADRRKTEQIILNIISNAVKFTPEGGKVTTTCGVTGDESWITVSDTGSGIPEEKRDEIFEPFVQLGRTLSSLSEGTGLGLAISRDLARAMNGNITVEEAPGGGAKFTLFLPGA